ncbi:MAG: protein-disulfide reductase DsbD family protein [Phycisphaerales bacterium]|nr:protein-disulfide reductase DsbD family protein [Phycisphaerales bacterium]
MFLLAPLVAATMLAPYADQPAEPAGKRKELVAVSLLPHDTAVKPGDTVQLAVVFDVAKDWHIYWPGQNDSGMATTVELSFPPGSGLTAGPVSFPIPKRYVEEGDILNYIHEGRVVVTVPVTVPATAPVGRAFKVTASVNYLVCKESCIPGEAVVSATFTTADKTAGNAADAKAIDDARAAQPKPQADGFDAAATAHWEGQTLVLTAKDAAVTQVTFFPSEGGAKLRNPLASGQSKGGTLKLAFDPGLKPVEGVVEFTSGNSRRAWAFHSARPQETNGEPAPASPKPAPLAPPAEPSSR